MTKYGKMGLFTVLIIALVPAVWAVNSTSANKNAGKNVNQKPVSSVPTHLAKAKKSVKNAPIVVETTKVKTMNLPNTVQALGSLSALQVVTVSSEADGRVDAIHFKDGAQVGKGMPIIQLDNEKVKADYQTAVTKLKLAQKKYDRSKQLLNEAISQQELDKLKADVDNARAAVQSAQAALSQKQILAPFSGVLGAFKINVGDYIAAGTPLVNLVNTSQLKVNYNLAEVMLTQLKQGQLVNIKTSAYPKKTFYGTVNFISPTIDQSTRTVAVQAMVPNPKGLLSPGMFVHVSQQISMQKDALVIPNQSIMADVKGYYVFVVKNGTAIQTYIKLGQHIGEQARVLSGLKAGQVIVTAGQQKLQDGSLVQISQ